MRSLSEQQLRNRPENQVGNGMNAKRWDAALALSTPHTPFKGCDSDKESYYTD